MEIEIKKEKEREREIRRLRSAQKKGSQHKFNARGAILALVICIISALGIVLTAAFALVSFGLKL
jgi:hypothetical protein